LLPQLLGAVVVVVFAAGWVVGVVLD